MIFNFNITNDSLSLNSDFAAYSGNENYYLCKFNFLSSDWQGLSKFAVFTFNDTAVSVPLADDECMVPAQVLNQSGSFYLGVFGTNASEEDFRRISTGLICLSVGEGAYTEGSAPSAPAPDMWEIYLASVQDYVAQAQKSAESSASAAEIAKNEAESAYSNIISALEDYDIPGFMENVLKKDNAEEYTPSADFNPATKKYVDEANADTLESSKSYTDAAANAEAAAREAKDAELEGEIDTLKSKSIPHTTVSGYPLTVNDHLEGESVTNYKVYGYSYQSGEPTSDNPIEIQSVGDLVTDTSSEYYGKYDVPVTVCGKNLFDMETILPEQGWVKQDDGSYYVEKSSTPYQQILWENTENYTGKLKILFKVKYSMDNKNGCYLWVNYTDGTYSTVYCVGTVVANTWYYPESSRTITASNKIVQNISWAYGTGPASTWVKDIIITKDLTATEYEQYSGETKHIYLDAPLRKVGDYADYVDFENQKVVRNVIYAKFGQTSSWSTLSGYENLIVTTISNSLIGEGYPCLSNISNFEPGKYSDSTYTGLTSWTAARATIMWREDGITVDAFKERLATTPMFIICIRATPSEEPITVPELSAPNSAGMNVSSGTTISPSSIDLTYYQDINKVITNLTNAILAQGGNV